MCDPLTLGIVAGTAIVGGTAISAIGQVEEGNALRRQSTFQAQVAENNRIIAERSAQDAIARGKVARRQRGRETKLRIGAQRATLAGKGVVVDEGSAQQITEDEAAFGALDELTITSNAQREARGFRTQGVNFASDAILLRAKGSAAKRAAGFGVASTLLTGAGQLASVGGKFKRGGFGT